MQKKTKKEKRFTKHVQLRVRTGVKAGTACHDCTQYCAANSLFPSDYTDCVYRECSDVCNL